MFLHFPDGFSTSFCMFAEGSISSLAPAVPTNQLCTSGAGCEGVNGDHPFLLMSNTPRVSPQTTRSWGPILNQRFCKVLYYIRRAGKGFTLRMRIADSVFNPGIAAMETPKADTSCTHLPQPDVPWVASCNDCFPYPKKKKQRVAVGLSGKNALVGNFMKFWMADRHFPDQSWHRPILVDRFGWMCGTTIPLRSSEYMAWWYRAHNRPTLNVGLRGRSRSLKFRPGNSNI